MNIDHLNERITLLQNKKRELLGHKNPKIFWLVAINLGTPYSYAFTNKKKALSYASNIFQDFPEEFQSISEFGYEYLKYINGDYKDKDLDEDEIMYFRNITAKIASRDPELQIFYIKELELDPFTVLPDINHNSQKVKDHIVKINERIKLIQIKKRQILGNRKEEPKYLFLLHVFDNGIMSDYVFSTEKLALDASSELIPKNIYKNAEDLGHSYQKFMDYKETEDIGHSYQKFTDSDEDDLDDDDFDLAENVAAENPNIKLFYIEKVPFL